MRVAVIMSTYNGARYLSEQIESILNQEGVDIELFIRDDGSSDDTMDIISRYSEKYNNIHVDIGTNIGFRQSFIQELVKHDGFEYYAFSDQDDYWEKEKMKAACKMIQQEEVRDIPIVYYSNLKISDETLNVYKVTRLERRRHSLESAVMRRSIAGCTMVFNRRMWQEIARNDIADQMLRRGHDSFMISLCYSIGGTVICDSNAYIRYRQHQDNTSGGMHGPRQRVEKEWKAISQKKGQESEMANAILKNWSEEITIESKKALYLIASMNDKLSSKLTMFLSLDFRTGNFILTVLGKIKILTGLL